MFLVGCSAGTEFSAARTYSSLTYWDRALQVNASFGEEMGGGGGEG